MLWKDASMEEQKDELGGEAEKEAEGGKRKGISSQWQIYTL